jgi:CheY-like chemotaxis protein
MSDIPEEKKKIVIVEDDRFLSLVLKGRLEKEGYNVIPAYDGEEGLIAIKKELPALVVLDLVMPKMTGFELLEKLSADPQISRIPVVVASNLGQDSDIQKAKNLGVRDYYVKVQTSVDELVQMFKTIMDKGSVNKVIQ